MPRSAASQLGLYCLPVSHKKDTGLYMYELTLCLAILKQGLVILSHPLRTDTVTFLLQGEFLDKQIKKLSDRKVKCGLKKVTFASLENMRLVNVKVSVYIVTSQFDL